MDQRKEELKRLKKLYKRKKRKSVGVWSALAIAFLLIALVAAFVQFVPLLPAIMILLLFPAYVGDFLFANVWLIPASLGLSTVLFLLFAILAAIGRKRLKRSKEFFDYRTLKTTLKAEKEE